MIIVALVMSIDLLHSFGGPWNGTPQGIYEIGHRFTPERGGAMFVYGSSIKRIWVQGSAWFLDVEVDGKLNVIEQEHVDFNCSSHLIIERERTLFSEDGAVIAHQTFDQPSRHEAQKGSLEDDALSRVCRGVDPQSRIGDDETPQSIISKVFGAWRAWQGDLDRRLKASRGS